MTTISKEMREAAARTFSGEDREHPPCPDCGGVHPRKCPRIASERVVIDPSHTDPEGHPIITERDVTYWAPGTWEKYVLVWAEDIFDDDDESGGSPDAQPHDHG